MEFVFWLCAVGALYSYIFYPLILLCLPQRSAAAKKESLENEPSVTLIVTAYNEQERLDEKLRNTLALVYHRERLEIIVASDASSDATDDIVRRYQSQGVRLVRAEDRLGKEHAQGLAIKAARGDILVFTDVGTRLEPDAISILAQVFADPAVGAVSSEDRFINADGTIAGEGAYVKYEMWLRRLEASRHSLVGLSGSFFAARRDVCTAWDIHSPSDFNTAINSVRLGYVAVSEPRLLGFYQNIKDETKEYRRKLRTVIRGMTGLARNLAVLNPIKYGLFSFEVWSHKPMRWAVPWFMLGTALTSVMLAGRHWIYAVALGVQIGFYALAAGGWVSARLRANVAVRLAFYFVQVNAAIAHAALRFLFGGRMTVWEPSKR